MSFMHEKKIFGLSYTDLSLILGLDRALIWRCVKRPGSCSLKTCLSVAKVLEIPEEKARALWATERKLISEKKIEEKSRA